jgi:hypothetical protein
MKKAALSFLDAAWNTLRRFPLVIITALSASYMFSLSMGDALMGERMHDVFKWTQTFVLGIPLFFACSLLAERFHSRFIKLGIHAGSLLLLTWAHFHIEANKVPFEVGELSLLYLGYSLLFHLSVSFLPLAGKLDSEVFWHYNKTLFLRSAVTVLYTVVLYAGLAGALLAFENLLGFHLSKSIYGQLWSYMAGVGSVWIFLGGIPENMRDHVATGYPKGLQVFAQYILLPLVLLYLVILYVYGFKILYLWTLPVGWVSNLILAFSVLGMLTLLLLHPLANQSENRWIHRYTHFFYFAILPLLVLLFAAATTRIQSYGITELRYALLCLAMWLVVISLLMITRKEKHLYFIPVSLFVAVFWGFFMPGWNMKSISKRSQMVRLERLLSSQDRWNQKIVASDKPINDSISNEIVEAAHYLLENHGITGLEPVVKIPLEMQRSNMKWEIRDWLDEELASYGIVARNAYDEMAVQDTLTQSNNSTLNYPDLQIRLAGFNEERPKIIQVPTGNWNQCLEVTMRYGNDEWTDGIGMMRDATLRNVMVQYRNQEQEVFALDSLMGSHVNGFKKPSKSSLIRNTFRGSSSYDNIPLIQGKKATLQIFHMEYVWNVETRSYNLNHLTGRLWIP